MGVHCIAHCGHCGIALSNARIAQSIAGTVLRKVLRALHEPLRALDEPLRALRESFQVLREVLRTLR